ncbi:MAG: hypothetical protein JW850_20840, partial [Thermoflexales bacterium]|nr:hypothetical protein [Thermoflexales bacterium]
MIKKSPIRLAKSRIISLVFNLQHPKLAILEAHRERQQRAGHQAGGVFHGLVVTRVEANVGRDHRLAGRKGKACDRGVERHGDVEQLLGKAGEGYHTSAIYANFLRAVRHSIALHQAASRLSERQPAELTFPKALSFREGGKALSP